MKNRGAEIIIPVYGIFMATLQEVSMLHSHIQNALSVKPIRIFVIALLLLINTAVYAGDPYVKTTYKNDMELILSQHLFILKLPF